jgi:molecular chaperone IbpA
LRLATIPPKKLPRNSGKLVRRVGFDQRLRAGDNEYRIDLAVAGFKPDEIDITAHQNVLIVSGRKKDEAEDKGSDYIYRGIATRSFERRFALADHVQVRDADLKDGLLSVQLVREIPEAMKPRKISVNGGSEQREERSAIGGGEARASHQTVEAQAEHA